MVLIVVTIITILRLCYKDIQSFDTSSENKIIVLLQTRENGIENVDFFLKKSCLLCLSSFCVSSKGVLSKKGSNFPEEKRSN